MNDVTPEPELPHAVALAWGVAANPQRGPKRELSIERIVDTAVDIADAGGLSAVSMSSVAAALGFTTMSLYRYVTAKDDLVMLMQERGIGVPPETIAEASGWRAGLSLWVAEQTAVYGRHPWLLDVPIAGTPATPNNLAWLDAALQTLAGTPLDQHERLSIVLAVMAQSRWEGLVSRSYEEAARQAGITPDDIDARGSAMLEQLVTAEEFPAVYEALHAGVFGPAGPSPFPFGLARIIDGVESYFAGREATPPEPVDPLLDRAEREPKVREAAKARREAEKQLREARKRERQALAAARDRLSRQ